MDIQMPDLTGLQLSKIVKGKTNIILRPPTRNLRCKAMKLMRLIIY
jgi:CheY-like chemotaxis protein